MSTIIIGSGSGLGLELYKQLSRDQKVYGFSSKKINEFNFKRLDLINFDVTKFENDLANIGEFKEVYYLPNLAQHKIFKNLNNDEVNQFINFNFNNYLLILKSLINLNSQFHFKMILSHINFMFNSGFAIYKSQKIFQKEILDNLKIENPKLKVSYYYPGAMNTNFAKNVGYNGIKISKPIDVKKVAYEIVHKDRKIFSLMDWTSYFIYSMLPREIVILIYKSVIFLFKKNNEKK